MSEEQKQSVTVRIGGEEHVIKASAEAEHTKRCARWVDERIMEVREQAGLIESHRAVILAAMSIADEFFQARDELEGFRKEVASRATNLMRRIETELAPEEEEDDATESPGASGEATADSGSETATEPDSGAQPDLGM